MFIDSAKFNLKAGKGGAGCVSFRREKHILLGGPDGGDGGDGGSIYFKVDSNTHTLSSYKGKKSFKAKNGDGGMGRKMSGKKGENLYLIVPPGTSVFSQDGELLLDLLNDGETKLFLKGGKGGLGNVHFKNSVNQRPDYAQPGLPGEEKDVKLELRLIADVGLVGFPNVGKSTLISTISNAKPQIANYEFTTITPKLGKVDVDEFHGFIMADIPGIIEGASDGRGLGLQFLKHIERTKVLLFMLDVSNYRSLKEQFLSLKDELVKFGDLMNKKDFAIAITKTDTVEDVDMLVSNFLKEDIFSDKKPIFVMPISAATNFNIPELKFKLYDILQNNKA